MANEQDVEIDFTRYVAILSRRRWIVALTAFVVIVATGAYAFLATPVYRSSTLINVEQPTKSIAEVAATHDQDEDYFDTQYKLMTSDTLLERVYNDLKLGSVPEF